MPAINLKKLSLLFAVLFLSMVAYDTCRPVYATEQSVQLIVPGCTA